MLCGAEYNSLGNVKITFKVGVRKVGENDKKVGFLYLKWYTTINGQVSIGQTERLGYIYETV